MRAYGPVPADHAPTRVPTAALAALGIGALTYGAQDGTVLVAAVLCVGGVVVALPALRRLLPAGTMTAAVGLSAVIACRTLATAAFLGVDSFVPLAAHEIHGASALLQGFLIVGAAISWTGGQWWRARHPGTSTASATRVGFLFLALGAIITWPVVFEGWPLWATFLTWCVGGLGMGLLFNPTSLAAMSYARSGQEGIVSSQTHLADSLGFSLMGGYGGALVAGADRGSWSITSALSVCMLSAAALAAVGALVAGQARRAAGSPQAAQIALR